MNIKRKDDRLEIKLSSSIKGTGELKRNFCIIRNISKKGVLLTAKSLYVIGQTVECIISFDGKSINFFGIVRRISQDVQGVQAYGIEIIELSESDEAVLNEFVEAEYLPSVEE